MATGDVCPVCKLHWFNRKEGGTSLSIRTVEGDLQEVQCLRCGAFRISGSAFATMGEDPDWKVAGFLRHRYRRAEPMATLYSSSPPEGGLSIPELRRAAPTADLEVRDRILVTLTAMTAPGENGTLGEYDSSLAYSGKLETLASGKDGISALSQADAGDRLLPDGMGDAASAEVGAGAPWA